MNNYYNQSISAIVKELESSTEGLSEGEAKHRLAKNGLNELKEKKKSPTWLIFLNQFKDFMILILGVAAILSGIMGDITDMIIIFVIIILNAIVGFIQEYRAEKTMEALKKMTIAESQVIREGKTVVISSTEIVVGDVVVLEAGNVVPADMRILETNSLRIDESSLTGESVSIDKISEDLKEEDISIGDQLNMAFKGTLVTNGRAKGLVVKTGMNTELGRIADLLQEKKAATPL